MPCTPPSRCFLPVVFPRDGRGGDLHHRRAPDHVLRQRLPRQVGGVLAHDGVQGPHLALRLFHKGGGALNHHALIGRVGVTGRSLRGQQEPLHLPNGEADPPVRLQVVQLLPGGQAVEIEGTVQKCEMHGHGVGRPVRPHGGQGPGVALLQKGVDLLLGQLVGLHSVLHPAFSFQREDPLLYLGVCSSIIPLDRPGEKPQFQADASKKRRSVKDTTPPNSTLAFVRV